MSGESEDEFDITKVKPELGDDDAQRLKKEAESSNADVEQLAEIERKEDEAIEAIEGEEDIIKVLSVFNARYGGSTVVRDFVYDKAERRWCCLKFEVPIKFRNIDMTNVLREAAKNSIIWEVPKIKRAFTHKQNDVLVVTTDGINIGVRTIKT